MLQSRRLSQKISGQGQKNVLGRIVPSHITKLFIILYGLVKITSGSHTLESVPEKKIIEIRTVYPPEFNHTQCYNMPSSHQFTFKISMYLPQLNINLNDTVLAAVLEEYYHYAYLFHDELEEEVRKRDFAFNKRTQIHLATIVKENNRKLLRHLAPYIVMLIIIGKIFGYKTVLLVIFATNLIQQTKAEKPTTLQSLHNTLLYIRFRIHYNWMRFGFGEKQYREMEAGLVDAIIQLWQLATPPPPKPTSATKIPMRDSKQAKQLIPKPEPKPTPRIRAMQQSIQLWKRKQPEPEWEVLLLLQNPEPHSRRMPEAN
jgi:hypothetical protein